MNIIITFLSESFKTNRTSIWNLARVNPLMVLEVIFTVKALITVQTLVLLLTPVLLHVHPQVVLVHK